MSSYPGFAPARGSSVRFAVLNDLHAQFAPSETMHPGYPGASRRAEWLLSQIGPDGTLADIDFVVSGGDLIHGESLASIGVEMAALRERLQQLPVPFYPCCGNHEIEQAEGDAAYEAPYRRYFGNDGFDYSIPAGAVEIIVLNNAGSFHVTRERREERARSFQRLLLARPKVPKILICHIPLECVREQDVLRESFGFRTYRCLEHELTDILDINGINVRLVISGHLHLTGMVERRGVRHLVTSGTASFPHDYPVVTVTDQTIEVDVRSLPPELHEPLTNLHGLPRYPKDFVDGRHPTAEAYLRGLPAERRFSIPLHAANPAP